MAHAQKPDFVFRQNGRDHLNRRGRQFSLLAAEKCPSAVVMLNTPCSEVVWRVMDTHSIRQFPLHFPFRASPCVITFHLDSTTVSVQIRGKCVCFVTMTVFTVRSCQHLAQPSSWRTTPCLLSATTYSIHLQLPSILEDIPPSTTQGRTMTQWQRPTYHGTGHIRKEKNLSPASKQLNHSSLFNQSTA